MKFDPKWLLAGLTDEQARGAVKAGWRLLIVTHIAWACGILGHIGLVGFARADDVDKKIAAAVEPIKQEMSEQRTILNEVSQQLKDTLAENKASEIRHLVSRRCKETNTEERNRIIKEIDRKQEEYKRLRGGERYAITCEEV